MFYNRQRRHSTIGYQTPLGFDDGIACVDNLKWDAFHEGGDLKAQVEAYRKRMGCYPEAVYADPAYGSRENRAYLKSLGIRFAGKPLGRPRKETEETG